MPLTSAQQEWYARAIVELDPDQEVVRLERRPDPQGSLVHYSPSIRSDESNSKPLTPEEWVHALTCVLLVKRLGYPVDRLVHERHIAHGSAGSSADEMDIIVLDGDGRPYAAWELKSAEAYAGELESATRLQLFGTVPLLTEGAPTFIVCATIDPLTAEPELRERCIDYREHKDYDAWVAAGMPVVPAFPRQYFEPDYEPYTRGGARDLKTTCTLAEFTAVATSFHNEFFSEHPDNQLFEDLLRCLLAKIYSEKNTQTGSHYEFQILMPLGKPESAEEVFRRVSELYARAYRHYIDPAGSDEIDSRRFAPERVKSVVQQLEGMALTKGAALNADIIGAFFEKILRAGFKQDRGMYFTHDNIVRFMVEAVGLRDLTRRKWREATHPEQRLPYVFDPACGSGTFLLHAMHAITDEVRSNRPRFARTESDEDFLNQHLSDASPNGWARDFLYGFDPKFIMAMTAKLNMVLHGDGVAHLFKEDAYKPIGAYHDARLRPAGAPARSLPKNAYPPQMCETFDVVISNPPFGVTLSPETRQTLMRAFALPSNTPTEALFIERAFQLLRPNGRLAVVLPESILNAADPETRLFLMRMFHVRAVVTMPRHIFVDTPTLTSLLFAQKKLPTEIEHWDRTWSEELARVQAHVATARRHLTVAAVRRFASPGDLEAAVLGALAAVGPDTLWVMRRGQNGGPLTFKLPRGTDSTQDAARHYQDLLRTPGFQDLVRQAVFGAVAARLDAAWPCYAVEEVGFKLSRRGERVRENQLATFVGKRSGRDVPNLHLANEDVRICVNRAGAKTVLDCMATDVVWR